MHERTLVRALLAQVGQLLIEHQARRVVSVRVLVGEFSGIEPALFRSAFEEMSSGVPFRETALEMNTVELAARCRTCGREFRVEAFHFLCPQCGCHKTVVIRGEELTLESVTFEED